MRFAIKISNIAISVLFRHPRNGTTLGTIAEYDNKDVKQLRLSGALSQKFFR